MPSTFARSPRIVSTAPASHGSGTVPVSRMFISDWTRDTMLLFLCEAYRLMSKAIAARDRGGGITAPQAPLNDAVPW